MEYLINSLNVTKLVIIISFHLLEVNLAASNFSVLWKHLQNMESVKRAGSTLGDTKILTSVFSMMEIRSFSTQKDLEDLHSSLFWGEFVPLCSRHEHLISLSSKRRKYEYLWYEICNKIIMYFQIWVWHYKAIYLLSKMANQ